MACRRSGNGPPGPLLRAPSRIVKAGIDFGQFDQFKGLVNAVAGLCPIAA